MVGLLKICYAVTEVNLFFFLKRSCDQAIMSRGKAARMLDPPFVDRHNHDINNLSSDFLPTANCFVSRSFSEGWPTALSAEASAKAGQLLFLFGLPSNE